MKRNGEKEMITSPNIIDFLIGNSTDITDKKVFMNKKLTEDIKMDIDVILDKIGKLGIDSLSDEERKFLKNKKAHDRI